MRSEKACPRQRRSKACDLPWRSRLRRSGANVISTSGRNPCLGGTMSGASRRAGRSNLVPCLGAGQNANVRVIPNGTSLEQLKANARAADLILSKEKSPTRSDRRVRRHVTAVRNSNAHSGRAASVERDLRLSPCVIAADGRVSVSIAASELRASVRLRPAQRRSEYAAARSAQVFRRHNL